MKGKKIDNELILNKSITRIYGFTIVNSALYFQLLSIFTCKVPSVFAESHYYIISRVKQILGLSEINLLK